MTSTHFTPLTSVRSNTNSKRDCSEAQKVFLTESKFKVQRSNKCKIQNEKLCTPNCAF